MDREVAEAFGYTSVNVTGNESFCSEEGVLSLAKVTGNVFTGTSPNGEKVAAVVCRSKNKPMYIQVLSSVK